MCTALFLGGFESRPDRTNCYLVEYFFLTSFTFFLPLDVTVRLKIGILLKIDINQRLIIKLF